MVTLSTPLVAFRLKDIPSHLVNIVFDSNATADQLFLVVLAFAIAWFLIFFILKSIIRPLVHNKPWLIEAIERDYERAAKKMLVDLKIKMTREECIAWTMNDWPRMQCIYLQHLVGSIFCIPSIFGIGDPSIASSLAICGILSEIGWELQDIAEMYFVRLFCKNGKAIWPDSIVTLFMVHHSLSTILGLPMILYYRENRTLHWLCFDLQFAAAIALAIGETTKLLNISKPSSLRLFKVLNSFAFVTMLWTRVIHYIYLCFELYAIWWGDKAFLFLSIGLLLSVAFFLFSFLCCVKPFYKKFVKFLHVSTEYETLPSDITPEKRRASIVKLDDAVAELLDGGEMIELADLVAPLFVKRKTSRRQSAPVINMRKMAFTVTLHSKSFGGEASEKSKDL